MAKSTRFEAVYKNLSLPLTKFVTKRVSGDSRAAEEVIASTMVAGWRGWKTFRHKSSYFTWLCRIALNKIADYYRDQIHERSRIVVPTLKAMSMVEANDVAPEERMALDELRKMVNDCLNLLPYEKRRLLWFRYWKDLSYRQIANMVGLSERAVEGKLYRARHEFANLYRNTFRGKTTTAL